MFLWRKPRERCKNPWQDRYHRLVQEKFLSLAPLILLTKLDSCYSHSRAHPSRDRDLNSPITLRTRKFLSNRLLQRRQMVLEVIHPARPNVSRSELQEKIGELYKTPKEQVSVFGMRTHFGGGRSTGFALVYDSQEAMKSFEPTHRIVRNGLAPKIEKASRKLRKERKNRGKKVRGTKKGDSKKK
ncbi:hypothetical protein MGL_2960 [Malassezia globosa CBS 7966]|uniref:40S ribosomal protein S24 n=1 Tax=Malassezia globosa (strain ATCC MYA-4612 / CBS 7966) TaxID=425265 RepID=A8Q6G6_MALGO|nr:uncharacterized protein MGL_2960 [Malassezia globosa CBS 7966]EDP42760.1 hypothetical protein MGL_2960 [Malassezia globosa CBS 7966]